MASKQVSALCTVKLNSFDSKLLSKLCSTKADGNGNVNINAEISKAMDEMSGFSIKVSDPDNLEESDITERIVLFCSEKSLQSYRDDDVKLKDRQIVGESATQAYNSILDYSLLKTSDWSLVDNPDLGWDFASNPQKFESMMVAGQLYAHLQNEYEQGKIHRIAPSKALDQECPEYHARATVYEFSTTYEQDVDHASGVVVMSTVHFVWRSGGVKPSGMYMEIEDQVVAIYDYQDPEHFVEIDEPEHSNDFPIINTECPDDFEIDDDDDWDPGR